ncbi:unnamed protein product [Acanthoscelides obtectus]|uniref:Uncharacterized protein n=2 Tax=Acanthoscelides obtectus TaxID=200917 RepID=A0A9P0NY42_ACAOB|nr:unnamed protein product [Acanthoscelides obtectus]CAK1667035.1 hypothetical protein AOBTE_LOCUS25631 [Acanthoscelides obtectus]
MKGKMLLPIFLLLSCSSAISQQYYQIEDIPIEQFVQTELEDDAIDFELMPRQPRSFLKSQLDKTTSDQSRPRSRRDISVTPTTLSTPIDITSIVNDIGKPLELVIIDPDNTTEKPLGVVTELPVTDETEDNNVLINDYIRFRRNAGHQKGSETERNVGGQDRNEPEPRGATKDQWVKQQYPVRNDEIYDDPAPRENVRAPRVNFVTHGLGPPPPRYGREPRVESRDIRNPRDPIGEHREPRGMVGLNKDFYERQLIRDLSSEMDYYYPRYSRPWRQGREDPYYYRAEPRDRYSREPPPSRYRNSRVPPIPPVAPYYDRPRAPFEEPSTVPPKRKQRRIIYYANLPDPPRTPPNVDLRERYDYRDRYDDRYYTADPYRGPPRTPPYRNKAYLKDRYGETVPSSDKTTLYPVKVGANLNVREVKKVPEGRIYSNVDNRARYGEDTLPYPSDRL